MQGQPEADRRGPGPAQDQAFGGHGQGQDVSRRNSCRQEGGVEPEGRRGGAPGILYGTEDFCLRSVVKLYSTGCKNACSYWYWNVSKLIADLSLKSSNRPIQCKKEAKLDYYADNNTKFISRLKKMANVGLGPLNEIWTVSKINILSWFQTGSASPRFEVLLVMIMWRRSENKVGWHSIKSHKVRFMPFRVWRKRVS